MRFLRRRLVSTAPSRRPAALWLSAPSPQHFLGYAAEVAEVADAVDNESLSRELCRRTAFPHRAVRVLAADESAANALRELAAGRRDRVSLHAKAGLRLLLDFASGCAAPNGSRWGERAAAVGELSERLHAECEFRRPNHIQSMGVCRSACHSHPELVDDQS